MLTAHALPPQEFWHLRLDDAPHDYATPPKPTRSAATGLGRFGVHSGGAGRADSSRRNGGAVGTGHARGWWCGGGPGGGSPDEDSVGNAELNSFFFLKKILLIYFY
eukprot:Rmarinus@m.12554